MGQKYVILTSDNSVQGFYDSDIHDNIPVGAIEISESTYREYFSATFYKVIFREGGWAEGLSQQEIDSLNNQPKSPTPEEKITSLENELIMTNALLLDFMESMLGGI